MAGVILGHARSGSSELARAISDATGEPLRMEPFHRAMGERGVALESPEFPGYLEEVMAGGGIIKHMWNGVKRDLNAAVLSHPSVQGVVFIYRRDTVQAALSTIVARLTGKWGKWEGEIAEPLPLDDIENRVTFYRNGQRMYREMLQSYAIPHIEVAYEDLYTSSRDSREAMLRDACSLMGLPVLDISSGAERLSPDRRYHSDEFYKQAPNWAEFEERFL